ncbi:MAG TPA: aldose epimerase family protein [Planctomycetota bacterium]|nr:aldose epimerase family protein [Planctomycetota bacterium]
MTMVRWAFLFGMWSIASAEAGMQGEPKIEEFTLRNASGMTAKLTNYGTILMELHVPDRDGKTADVVLGLDKAEDYQKGHPFFGATAGRVANRIANASFTLDGKEYPLAKNNGPHTLHGGVKGWDKYVWEASKGEGPDGSWVSFTRSSPDGEEGFPGTVKATVLYRLTPKNELIIEFTATTDKPTLVNLANHSYWNLGGHASGSVLDHELQLFCDRYTPGDDTLVPNGKIEPVAGGPFDFTKAKKIGRDFEKTGVKPVGYDTNFVVNGTPGELRPAARVVDAGSGRVMDVLTTEPGVQFYTGNFLNGSVKGKGGVVYVRHAGFCLETQKYPDAIHHPEWPQPVLRPGETYRHTVLHRFSTQK